MNKIKASIFTLGPASSSAVRDPSFPRIAAKAALELDGALSRKRNDVGAVKILATVVRTVADQARDTDTVQAMIAKLDAATTNVFLRAYESVGAKVEPKHFGTVTTRVAVVLEQVADKESELPDVPALENARNFCRALSSQAAGKQRISYSNPSHAFLRKVKR